MVAAVSVENTQADISVVSETATNADVAQADTLAVFNIPADRVDVSGIDLVYPSLTLSDVEVSQADMIVVYSGRVENPSVRVWYFPLDGHDFYVLRLGDGETLVYDLYSEQWVDWRSPDLPFWRVNYGINWIGGEAFGAVNGSNIVAGDDAYGLVWFLDPTQPFDQNPLSEAEQQRLYFPRIVMGQVSIKGRKVMPCYAAWLTTDMGEPAYEGASVTLALSDDAGETFYDCGSAAVTEGVFNPEISWYSLGQIEAPGRLFMVTDDGAIARIDGLEMNDSGSDDDG